jgi:hypothetical protein
MKYALLRFLTVICFGLGLYIGDNALRYSVLFYNPPWEDYFFYTAIFVWVLLFVLCFFSFRKHKFWVVSALIALLFCGGMITLAIYLDYDFKAKRMSLTPSIPSVAVVYRLLSLRRAPAATPA